MRGTGYECARKGHEKCRSEGYVSGLVVGMDTSGHAVVGCFRKPFGYDPKIVVGMDSCFDDERGSWLAVDQDPAFVSRLKCTTFATEMGCEKNDDFKGMNYFGTPVYNTFGDHNYEVFCHRTEYQEDVTLFNILAASQTTAFLYVDEQSQRKKELICNVYDYANMGNTPECRHELRLFCAAKGYKGNFGGVIERLIVDNPGDILQTTVRVRCFRYDFHHHSHFTQIAAIVISE